MSTPKKLPSGNWRVRIYDYTDSAGKQHYKSFTASTRREVERLVRQYQAEDHIHGDEDLTVSQAVKGYIDLKEAALSPSTIAGYTRVWNNYIAESPVGKVKLSLVTEKTLQRFISELVGRGLSPKTVKCTWQLVHPALKMYTKKSYEVTLPSQIRPQLHTPTDAEVSALIRQISENRELCIMVLLCAYGPMRRSEACAIRFDDIDGDFVTVQRSIVKDKNKEWIVKPTPKTYASFRTIQYPHQVIEYIGRGIGPLITIKTPDQLSEQFRHAVRNAGLPHFRLHDLRHYGASILHAIGIPDEYIIKRGGWATDGVMKRIYRDTLSDVEQEMNSRIIAHFSAGLDDIKHDTEKKKALKTRASRVEPRRLEPETAKSDKLKNSKEA